jgi:hypothetical protein
MKTIILRDGAECFVSDEDFRFLSRWKWKRNTSGYACRNVTDATRSTVLLFMSRTVASRMGLKMRLTILTANV